MNSSPEATNNQASPETTPSGLPAASPSPLLAPFPGATSSAAGRTLPTKSAGRRLWPWVALGALLLVAGDAAGYFLPKWHVIPDDYSWGLTNRLMGPGDGNRPDVLTHKVKRENLEVKVTEKGTLESANNR